MDLSRTGERERTLDAPPDDPLVSAVYAHVMVRVASGAVLSALLIVTSCGGKATHLGAGGHAGAGSDPAGGRADARGGRGNVAGEHGGVAGDARGAGQGGTAGFGGAAATAGRGTGAAPQAGNSGHSTGGFGGIEGEPSDAGQSAGGAAAGEAGSAGEPGDAGGSGEFAPRASCGTTYPPNAVKCDGLNQVTISVGPFLDADGNAGVSPGEDAKVVLTLHNTASQTFDSPCVGLLADSPAISHLRGDSGDYNPWPKYFAILADQSLDFRASFHVDERATPGTVIHFVAWVTLQTAGCTNGNEIELSLEVAP